MSANEPVAVLSSPVVVLRERFSSDGRVLAGSGIICERPNADGRIVAGSIVATQCVNTVGCVSVASGVCTEQTPRWRC